MQLVTQNLNGCSIAPIADYENNSMFQELLNEDTYFFNSNERIHLDLQGSKGYTNKNKKLRGNDSNLVLKIKLKYWFTKKCA